VRSLIVNGLLQRPRNWAAIVWHVALVGHETGLVTVTLAD